MKQVQLTLSVALALLVLNPAFLRLVTLVLPRYIGDDLTQKLALPVLAALMLYTWLSVMLYVLCGQLLRLVQRRIEGRKDATKS